MRLVARILALLPLALAAIPGGVRAAPPENPARRVAEASFSPAPLPPGEKAAWQHSPYASGDCSICHERNDRKSPGKVTVEGNELCFGCHEEFGAIANAKHTHGPVRRSCVACHNPHDARNRKLLHLDPSRQCLACHVGIADTVARAAVKHGALSEGRQCLNCHDPHGSPVEKLLTALPYDQCVTCHSSDALKDDRGVPLTNFKKLLEANAVRHAPVESKDCSACHRVHGGENFRMLVAEYPSKFYAPFDPKSYALCFGCHNDKVVSEPVTTTLTAFRDGARNLHFVHVNKPDRGRTCRACHEVHASPNDHQLRKSVPYGPKGWQLEVGYERTATGGTCAKTCHDAKSYVNRPAPSTAAAEGVR